VDGGSRTVSDPRALCAGPFRPRLAQPPSSPTRRRGGGSIPSRRTSAPARA